MCPDEFDQHPSITIGDMDDQPVFIAADIENDTMIGNKISGAEIRFNFGGRPPDGMAGAGKP